jgi:hypothetical protein
LSFLNDKYQFFLVDVDQWQHLLSALPLFQFDRGGLYLLYHEQKITYALHTRQGRRTDFEIPFTSPALITKKLQEELDIDAVIMIDQTLAGYLLAKVQAMFSPTMDIFDFLDITRQSLEEELGQRFHVWPREFWNRSGLNLLQNIRMLLENLPKDLLGLVVIFKETEIWASLIIEIQEGKITRVTTTKALEPIDFTISDWQEDYKQITKRVEQLLGKPTIGLFTDDETFRFLLRSSQPLDYIRQARRLDQIIIDPLPSRLRTRI